MDVVVERGPGGRLTPATRQKIQQMFLLENASRAAIARQLQIDRQTVTRALSGDDFDALEKTILDGRKSEAMKVLARKAEFFADEWVKAVPIARKKGNHKPSEDALKALGLIKGDESPRVLVQVGVKLTGSPEL